MQRDVSVSVSAATAYASAPTPRVHVTVLAPAAIAIASAPSPKVIRGVATGIALVLAGGHRLFVEQPARPELGYHLPHKHGDVLGAVAFGFGMAALTCSLWVYARTFKL